MHKSYFSLIFICLIPLLASAQSTISIKDIWSSRKFSAESVEKVKWMEDGRHYTALETAGSSDRFILKYDIVSGEVVDTLVDSRELKDINEKIPVYFSAYSFSKDEDKVLLQTQRKPIYRRSFTAKYYVFDIKNKKLDRLYSKEAQSYATFSPDGKKVAFVSENNLYYKDLKKDRIIQVTEDGKNNEIINGSTDWVYEEEFAFVKAFFWSPKSDKLAFLKFDEAHVEEYNMQVWSGLYNIDYKFKYPKAGKKNAYVSVHVYDLKSTDIDNIDVGEEKDQYIPRLGWTRDNDILSVRRMNRLQNELEILHFNLKKEDFTIAYSEKSDTYTDIYDDLYYLPDGERFCYTSEKDGFKHLYLYSMEGEEIKQITKGDWEIDDFYGIDEKENLAFYTSTEVSPLERHIYSINIQNGEKKKLSDLSGTHSALFSTTFDYYLNYFSSVTEPKIVRLYKADNNQLIKVLEENKELKKSLKGYGLSDPEFVTFTNDSGVELNGYIIKPKNFNKDKKYPLLMYVYGGPGSQNVKNSWMGANYMWYQKLANEGYIIACFDNRGTGGRGADFKKCTYRNLGKLETADQIGAARWMAKKSYIDENRIGIWGWSYGGYMSSLCILLGNDIFSFAIAVAPVSNWRFYDTIYTERYMGLPQDNADGYDAFAPMAHAEKLEGDYLLIHGTADDNVHFQNAVFLQNALISANKQFSSFYYPNRNHGIYGGNTREHLYQMMDDFIKTKL